MASVQAIAISCSDPRLVKHLPEFFENQLNFYAVDPKTAEGGVKLIFEGGEPRELLFKDLQVSLGYHAAPKIILINHQDCQAYSSKQFATPDDEMHEHEVQLRHAVSDVRARFPNKEVEAYFAVFGENDQVTFKKVI